MKLISLRVEAFKKLRHAQVTFGPRVTVLHGPNEIGKSTLAEALRAVLLVSPGTKEAEGFIPWDDPKGRANVVLTFEVAGARYRVDKTFGVRPRSTLERADLAPASAYRPVVDGRGVDGELRKLLAWGVPGPALRGQTRKASSFLVTAFLGRQGAAAEIFEASLASDGDATGRASVTQAVGALARDPKVEALLEKLRPRVALSFGESGQLRRANDTPVKKASDALQQAEQELQRLKEKDDAAARIAARLAQCVQEHDVRVAELEARRSMRDALRAAAEAASARAALMDGEQRVVALSAARAKLEVLLADEQVAVQTLQARDAALTVAKTDSRTLDEQIAEARQAVSARAIEDAVRRSANEARVADVARSIEARESAQRAVSEAQQRLASAVEQAGFEAGARETAEAERNDVARSLDAARSDVVGRRASVSHALTAKLAAEAERKAVLGAAEWRRETIAQASTEQHRARAQREEMQQAHAEAVAKEAATVAAADAARQAREAEEVRVRAIEAALDSAEAERAGTRTASSPDIPSVPRPWSGKRLAASVAGVGLCVVAVLALLTGLPFFVATVSILAGLALLAGARWAGQPGARTAVAVHPELQSGAIGSRPGEQRVADLRTQIETAREVREASRVQEARSQSELTAARRVVEQLDVALHRAREDEKMRADAATRSHTSSLPGLSEIDAKLAAAVDAVADASSALSAAESLEQGLEGKLVVATDVATRAKVAEAMTSDAVARARAEAAQSVAQLAQAQAAETRVVEASASASSAQNPASSGLSPQSELAELIERQQFVTDGLAAAQEGRNKAAEALTSARTLVAEQRTAIARIDGEVARLQLDSLRDRAEAAARMLAQQPGGVARAGEGADIVLVEEACTHSADALMRSERDLSEIKGELKQAGGHATRERLESQRELVADRRAALEELEREETAAHRVFLALREAEERRAADVGRALARPVAERFARLTEGAYESVALDANLAGVRVGVNGVEREPDSLSVGAREQLATLMRLALAAQLRTAIVLDDQLVHSDTSRLAAVRTQLLASSREREHQILVFTCRPADYLMPDDSEIVAVDLSMTLRQS